MSARLSVVLLCLVIATTAAGQDWNPQIVDNSGDVGKFTSIAHDADGAPHIVYLDETNYRYMYAYYDLTAGAWKKEAFPEFHIRDANQELGSYADIAIDGSTVFLVLCHKDDDYPYDYANCYLKYKPIGSTLWTTVAIGNTESGTSYFLNPSIAISGIIRYITYYSMPKNEFFCFKYTAPDTWQEDPIDAALNVGYRSELTISPAGNVYVTYCETDGHMIRLGFKDGGNWFTLPIEPGADLDTYSSIAVDSNETVHIAFKDNVNGLKHAAVTRAKLLDYAAKQRELKATQPAVQD